LLLELSEKSELFTFCKYLDHILFYYRLPPFPDQHWRRCRLHW